MSIGQRCICSPPPRATLHRRSVLSIHLYTPYMPLPTIYVAIFTPLLPMLPLSLPFLTIPSLIHPTDSPIASSIEVFVPKDAVKQQLQAIKTGITHHTSHATLHTSHFTHHTSHTTLHTPHFTHHTSHITLHTSHFTLHTPHFTHHTPHFTHHTSHITLHTSHITHHSPHFTLHTPHTTYHTPHTTLHTSHTTLHTSHTTLHTPHFTHHTPHITLHTSHITHHTPHTTYHIPQGLIKFNGVQVQSTAALSKISTREVCKSIYKTKGLKGFYPSYKATLMRNIPSAAVSHPFSHVVISMCMFM